jgi:hypothetical protein
VGVKATKGAILTYLSILINSARNIPACALNFCETVLNLTNFVNYIGFQWQGFTVQGRCDQIARQT